MSAKTEKLISLGRICGLYGVRGWVKVRSYTEPKDNILGFNVWTLELQDRRCSAEVEEGRMHGDGVVAKLRGLDDRDAAGAWLEAHIVVQRAALPDCAPGEYYWADLEGLEVRTLGDDRLGTVVRLLATGVHDVLVVQGGEERLVPFVIGDVVRKVDLEAGVIIVDWEPDF